MRRILRILLWPIGFLLRLVSVLLYGLLIGASYFAGPLLTFLGICMLVSLFMKEWLNCGILSGMIAAVLLLYFGAAWVSVQIGVLSAAIHRF